MRLLRIHSGVEFEVLAGEIALHEQRRQHGRDENDDGEGVQDRQQAHDRRQPHAVAHQRDRRDADDALDLVELILGVAKLVVELRRLEECDVQRARLLDDAFLCGVVDPLREDALHGVGHRREQRLDEPQPEHDGHRRGQLRPTAAPGGCVHDPVDDDLGHVDHRRWNQRHHHHECAREHEQEGCRFPKETVDARHDPHDFPHLAAQLYVLRTGQVVHRIGGGWKWRDATRSGAAGQLARRW